jgi:hypothetical protein
LVLLVAAFSAAQTTGPITKPTAAPAASAPATRPASTMPAGKAAIEKTDAGPGWFEFLFWSPLSGWIVGLAGIAATITVALRERRTKKPSFSCENFTLLREEAKKLEKLKVFYGEEPVSNLTVSVIAFWNAGSATIDGNDIAPQDPLTFKIEDGQLLDFSLKVRQDNKASNFSVGQSFDIENAAHLGFDFIESGQGVTFELFHTSTASEPVRVTGTIKGAGQPKHRDSREFGTSWVEKLTSSRHIPFIFTLIFATILSTGSILITYLGGSPFLFLAMCLLSLSLGYVCGMFKERIINRFRRFRRTSTSEIIAAKKGI